MRKSFVSSKQTSLSINLTDATKFYLVRAANKSKKKMDTTKIICTVIYVIMIAVTLVSLGNVGQYIDMPSAFIVVVVGVLFALAAKGDGSFIQKFGDGAVRAGWIGSIIGIIAIFGSEGFASGDMGQIGMALAVCSLTVFYGYLLKLGSLILD